MKTARLLSLSGNNLDVLATHEDVLFDPKPLIPISDFMCYLVTLMNALYNTRSCVVVFNTIAHKVNTSVKRKDIDQVLLLSQESNDNKRIPAIGKDHFQLNVYRARENMIITDKVEGSTGFVLVMEIKKGDKLGMLTKDKVHYSAHIYAENRIAKLSNEEILKRMLGTNLNPEQAQRLPQVKRAIDIPLFMYSTEVELYDFLCVGREIRKVKILSLVGKSKYRLRSIVDNIMSYLQMYNPSVSTLTYDAQDNSYLHPIGLEDIVYSLMTRYFWIKPDVLEKMSLVKHHSAKLLLNCFFNCLRGREYLLIFYNIPSTIDITKLIPFAPNIRMVLVSEDPYPEVINDHVGFMEIRIADYSPEEQINLYLLLTHTMHSKDNNLKNKKEAINSKLRNMSVMKAVLTEALGKLPSYCNNYCPMVCSLLQMFPETIDVSLFIDILKEWKGVPQENLLDVLLFLCNSTLLLPDVQEGFIVNVLDDALVNPNSDIDEDSILQVVSHYIEDCLMRVSAPEDEHPAYIHELAPDVPLFEKHIALIRKGTRVASDAVLCFIRLCMRILRIFPPSSQAIIVELHRKLNS